ncbi:MAG TPA: hypothetical protein VH639_25475 [Bryobacteraceae bacterium]
MITERDGILSRAGGAAPIFEWLTWLSSEKWKAFSLIFALSMSVRLISLARTPRERIVTPAEAEKIALALAAKGEFADPYVIPTGYTAHCPPFYPLLVSGIYRAFGSGYAGNMVRCILLISVYSIFYGLFPWFARAFGFPSAVGAMAGLVSAVVPLKRSAEVFLGWEEPYSAFLIVGLFLLTRRIWTNGGGLGLAVLYGVVWGVAFHMTPSLLPVALGLCAVDLFRFRAKAKTQTVGWWAISLTAMALTVLPWTVRNHERLGGWIFMRSNAGIELYIANQDGAQPSNGENAAVLRRAHPFRSQAVARRIKEIGEVAYNRELLQKTVAWMAARPWTFLSLTSRRVVYFWLGPPESLATTIPTAIITVLALLGLWTMGASHPIETWLFGTAWLLYPLIYYLVSYSHRYRAPMEWTITLCACAFVWRKLEAASGG